MPCPHLVLHVSISPKGAYYFWSFLMWRNHPQRSHQLSSISSRLSLICCPWEVSPDSAFLLICFRYVQVHPMYYEHSVPSMSQMVKWRRMREMMIANFYWELTLNQALFWAPHRKKSLSPSSLIQWGMYSICNNGLREANLAEVTELVNTGAALNST
jgi:hypothetical protein